MYAVREGRVCIIIIVREPGKVPRVGSAETVHKPYPGLVSSTSHHGRVKTEHDAAIFRVSFQNRMVTYKHILQNA